MYSISLLNEDQKPFIFESVRISTNPVVFGSKEEAEAIASFALTIDSKIKIEPEFRKQKEVSESTEVVLPQLESPSELNRNQIISALIKAGHKNEDLKSKTKVELSELLKLEESLGNS
jgi:hypothetical protein